MFEWKRRQYRETGAVDFLAQSEPRAYLEALVHKNLGRDFAGVLSALWAGTELLSVHLGMRAGGVLHWWFPTFDRRFAEYAPGRLMLLHLAEAAPDVGIDRIDLGKGVADYKQRTMTGAFDVCEGFVETRTLPRVLRRSRLAAAHRVRRTETFRRARSAKRTYQATGSLTAAAREARRKAG
jgi:CelD/BcsL family acetyltransferase involved in cellulose biosynthesis